MLVLGFLYALFSVVNGIKILGVFLTPSYSHQIVYQPIWRELSLRGHQVTVVTPNPLRDPSLTNLTEIDLSFLYEEDIKEFNERVMTQGTFAEDLARLTKLYSATGSKVLSHPPVRELVKNSKNETFDLFLVEFLWPTIFGFQEVYKCPMIGLSSLPLSITGIEAVGNPIHTGLDPQFFLPFSHNLSFKQRLVSTLYNLLYQFSLRTRLRPEMEKQKLEYFGDIRSLTDIAKNVSLVLVNSNWVIQNIKPVVPAYVEISGMHIKEPQALPKDLQKFLDESKEGVVYFSLGTNVKTKFITKQKLDSFLNVLGKIPYKVLWKSDFEDLSRLPKNVKTLPWVPQQDVLRHPNVKLFISQAGIQSLDEAIHFGVPMLAMPFFADQQYNSHRVRESGWGLSTDYFSFDEDEFYEKIIEVLTNPKYTENVAIKSKIVQDQREKSLDKAIWWIEYVIRHNGAKHLKYAGVDMPFYQFYLLDVIGFITAVLVLVLYVLLKIKRLVMNSFSSKKSHIE